MSTINNIENKVEYVLEFPKFEEMQCIRETLNEIISYTCPCRLSLDNAYLLKWDFIVEYNSTVNAIVDV